MDLILTAFFLKSHSNHSAMILSPGKTAVGYVGVRNSNMMDVNILRLISHFEKESICTIQFNDHSHDISN